MSTYPDGRPDIPNQSPVPGQRQPDVESGARARRALVRTATINGALLVVAILLAYVVPVTEDERIALAIVVGAAAIGAIHMFVVSHSESRRRSAALAAIPKPPPPSTSTPRARPYGAVGAPAESGFALTVEDVFSIAGRGTVVTGKVEFGELRTGDWVGILRHGQVVAEAEITGVERLRKLTDVASVGQNVGLLLADVPRSDIQRGDVISR